MYILFLLLASKFSNLCIKEAKKKEADIWQQIKDCSAAIKYVVKATDKLRGPCKTKQTFFLKKKVKNLYFQNG